MKKLLVLFLLILAGKSSLAIAGPKFELTYREQLAVYLFLKELSPNSPPNTFKSTFEASKYNTTEFQNKIALFNTIPTYYSYQLEGYPYGSKTPVLIENNLKHQLITSRNLDEFKENCVGLLPNQHLNQLTELIKTFTPIYNELIYLPNASQFYTQLTNLQRFVDENNIPAYFQQGVNFYGTTWDTTNSFKIAFYPLPDANSFTAEAFYNDAICALPLQFDENAVLMSVVLHEIYHILYNEQSPELKQEIYSYFQENPSEHSQYAYLLLNEALATALGNGYAFQLLNGAIDEGEWYYSTYINGMAKAIYPLVTDYLYNNKSIDKNFVDSYISTYQNSFSAWTKDMNHLMMNRAILTHDFSTLIEISQLYPYANYSNAMVVDEISPMEVQQLSNDPITKVVIISKNHQVQLASVKSGFAELEKWKFKYKEEFIKIQFLNDRTNLVIINQHNTPLKELLEKQSN